MKTFKTDASPLPVLVWRRNAADRARARKQDVPEDWPVRDIAMPGYPIDTPAHDRLRTYRGDWPALWRVCPKWGCIPLTREGDYGGFF